jgi:hypothetical protein
MLSATAEAQYRGNAGVKAQLRQTVSIAWTEVPLRQALDNLSQVYSVPVLIDRRVDPGKKLTLTLKDIPLSQIFGEIATTARIGYCQFGPLAYFGPSQVTSRLRTVAAMRREELRKLPSAVARKFLQAKRMKWDDFAMPRELLDKLSAESRIEFDGLQRVGHDLWAATNIPPMSLVDRITILVGQFGLTFKVSKDGKQVALVDFPSQPALVRSYPGGPSAAKTVARWAALVPNAKIKAVGEKIYVKGLLEEHEAITSPRRPLKRPTTKPTPDISLVRIDKLTVDGIPLGKLLQALADRLKLQLKMDRRAIKAAGVSLDRNVSLKVEKVGVDELFRTAIKSTGLTYRRKGRVIEITASQ